MQRGWIENAERMQRGCKDRENSAKEKKKRETKKKEKNVPGRQCNVVIEWIVM